MRNGIRLRESAKQLLVSPTPGDVHAIGLRVDIARAEVRGALVRFPPLIHQIAPDITDSAFRVIPSKLLSRLRSMEIASFDLELLSAVRDELDQLTKSVIQELLQCCHDRDGVLVIGCHGAGLWQLADRERPDYIELLNAASLAESFGITVIGDFPGRQLAGAGTAIPVETFGLGVLLGERDDQPGCRWRGLIEISHASTRFTVIPPISQSRRFEPATSFEIGPGLRLLAELSLRERGQVSKSTPDASADQCQQPPAGQVVTELSEFWCSVVQTERSDSWSPHGTSPLSLVYALEQSEFAEIRGEDLLATATHFLAQRVADHVLRGLPASQPIGELLVMGEGARNSHLMDRLSTLVSFVPIRRLEDIGLDRSLLAASLAALAMLHLWQIPQAARPGDGIARVLGSITPGKPANWRRVLQEMITSAPGRMPLREAI